MITVQMIENTIEKIMETRDHSKNGARPVKPTEQELNFNKQ
jgi:hypothetical protein